MFSRRLLTVLALLACYALPALAGRGLHGAERCACLPRGVLAVADGHRHAGCSHDHHELASQEGADRVGQAEPPHGSGAPRDCDVCFYLAQAQCALDSAAELPRTEPLAAVRIVWLGHRAPPVDGGYSPRGPPAFLA